MLILLAEDDKRLSKLLKGLLAKDNYQVDCAKDGEEAIMYCENNVYDLIILDWMMPQISGLEVVKKLRASGLETPILMLTAKDGLDDKVDGLESGVDDYLVKPFEYKELHARLKALLRRGHRRINHDILKVGCFELDRYSNSLRMHQEAVNLTKREYQLFSCLAENAGQIVSKQVLLDKVWGFDGAVTENSLEACIKRLRKKIDKDEKKYLTNVRGVGYRLEVK